MIGAALDPRNDNLVDLFIYSPSVTAENDALRTKNRKAKEMNPAASKGHLFNGMGDAITEGVEVETLSYHLFMVDEEGELLLGERAR